MCTSNTEEEVTSCSPKRTLSSHSVELAENRLRGGNYISQDPGRGHGTLPSYRMESTQHSHRRPEPGKGAGVPFLPRFLQSGFRAGGRGSYKVSGPHRGKIRDSA